MSAPEGWSAEELRRAGLEALGEHADERAREALAHAEIAVAVAVASWEGSSGRVRAHGVTLGLDARTLGAIRAAPALADGLCAALAAAIASRPGETLHDLHLRWAPGRASAAGYRDAPPTGTSLEEALLDYLRGAGEPVLADRVARATIDAADPSEVTLRAAPEGRAATYDAHASAMLATALRDLVGDPKARVRLR